jgi:arylsulfatase A-like enzyme
LVGYLGLRGTASTPPPTPPEPQCNVVLILIDTLRADRLGCHDNPFGLTPEIDRFAESAVGFRQAFAHAPWTLPSIASLLTSRHPCQHGAGGWLPYFQMLSQKAATLPEVLGQAGVTTGAIINVQFLTEPFGMTQGFDTVDADAPNSNVQVRRAGPTTDAALAWLRDHRDRAFFLMVHYFDPHLVYDPPQPFRRRFAEPRDRETTDYLFGTRDQMMALRAGTANIPPRGIARLEKLYNGEVAYTDSEVGRLLAGMSELGLDDDTVVVITSDHGEEFNDHGGFEHGHTLYDELLHVPLLIRAPGVPARTVHTAVRQIDVAPTLCELAGIPADPDFRGRSLLALMQGQSEDNRPVLSQGNLWGPPGQAWRRDGIKLVRGPAAEQVQLFDVISDPGEQHDLAAEAPDLRDRLVADLDLVLETFAAETVTGAAPTLSPEQLEHLRSLGYLK